MPGAACLSGQRAVYSNFGAAVDITAPGGDSDLGDDTYSVLSTLNSGTALEPSSRGLAPVAASRQPPLNAQRTTMCLAIAHGHQVAPNSICPSVTQPLLACFSVTHVPPARGRPAGPGPGPTVPAAPTYGALDGTSMATPHVSGLMPQVLLKASRSVRTAA